MSTERNNQDSLQEIKARKRYERFKQGGTNGGRIEVDHTIPKYAGGTDDEENLSGRTLPEHAKKHFDHAHSPPTGQNSDAEWYGTRHIIGRMNLDEFTDFLGMVEPDIPQLRETLAKKRGKPKK